MIYFRPAPTLSLQTPLCHLWIKHIFFRQLSFPFRRYIPPPFTQVLGSFLYYFSIRKCRQSNKGLALIVTSLRIYCTSLRIYGTISSQQQTTNTRASLRPKVLSWEFCLDILVSISNTATYRDRKKILDRKAIRGIDEIDFRFQKGENNPSNDLKISNCLEKI